MGVVISPPRYRPEIERAIRATTWNTPTLISSLICARIEDGTVARFETQKRRMRDSDSRWPARCFVGFRRQSSRFVLRLAAAG